jgi:predicted GIY-YIG superfamily endonuclease
MCESPFVFGVVGDDLAWTQQSPLRKWRRSWEMELIENLNPDWKDLSGKVIKEMKN